jgi:hypothetical protein
MDRVDGYLSRRAQQHWPGALVLELAEHRWVLRRPGQEDLGLGDNFNSAHHALVCVLRAEDHHAKT